MLKIIAQGRVYEAKRPATVGGGYLNDRQVLYVSHDGAYVQYDSPSVASGRKYPTISMEKFRSWAGRDVTDEMPKADWRPAR